VAVGGMMELRSQAEVAGIGDSDIVKNWGGAHFSDEIGTINGV
jgi:hypothetical protein